MHIIQPQQYLLRNLLHDMHRDALILVPPDQAEEILAEDLEDHADVGAVGPAVAEVVEEADDMAAAGVGGVGGDDALEELDLVEGCLCVTRCGLYDLEGDVTVHPEVIN